MIQHLHLRVQYYCKVTFQVCWLNNIITGTSNHFIFKQKCKLQVQNRFFFFFFLILRIFSVTDNCFLGNKNQAESDMFFWNALSLIVDFFLPEFMKSTTRPFFAYFLWPFFTKWRVKNTRMFCFHPLSCLRCYICWYFPWGHCYKINWSFFKG